MSIQLIFDISLVYRSYLQQSQCSPSSRSCLKEKTPRISLIVISIVPVITFIFIHAFGKMTTVIADGKIRLTWRYGFPTKEIQMSDIEAVEVKEISKWLGSGIKATRKGTVWRAWGKTVVAVDQSNGRRILIGSNNPEELARAIRSALHT
ncbi:MAG: hypothetical protein CM15mP49_38220 [Actinomycetota bacterium]|nr:MAG: hypothetical protein CM15mP49_38220 [Actinomycetota bacterium]